MTKIMHSTAGVAPMLSFAKKKSGTPKSAAEPKQITCRFVSPNNILLFTFVRSFGTVTYAIELTSVEKENAFPVRKDVSRNYD